jgi:hypothetical protein
MGLPSGIRSLFSFVIAPAPRSGSGLFAAVIALLFSGRLVSFDFFHTIEAAPSHIVPSTRWACSGEKEKCKTHSLTLEAPAKIAVVRFGSLSKSEPVKSALGRVMLAATRAHARRRIAVEEHAFAFPTPAPVVLLAGRFGTLCPFDEKGGHFEFLDVVRLEETLRESRANPFGGMAAKEQTGTGKTQAPISLKCHDDSPPPARFS